MLHYVTPYVTQHLAVCKPKGVTQKAKFQVVQKEAHDMDTIQWGVRKWAVLQAAKAAGKVQQARDLTGAHSAHCMKEWEQSLAQLEQGTDNSTKAFNAELSGGVWRGVKLNASHVSEQWERDWATVLQALKKPFPLDPNNIQFGTLLTNHAPVIHLKDSDAIDAYGNDVIRQVYKKWRKVFPDVDEERLLAGWHTLKGRWRNEFHSVLYTTMWRTLDGEVQDEVLIVMKLLRTLSACKLGPNVYLKAHDGPR